MIVADCSALVHLLVDRGPRGEAIAHRLSEVRSLAAPHLLDVELASALLGLARGRRGSEPKLDQEELERAMNNYRRLPVRRYEHGPLWDRVRQLSDNVSPYDAHYVALAEGLHVPLLTSDLKLAKSGAARCAVETF